MFKFKYNVKIEKKYLKYSKCYGNSKAEMAEKVDSNVLEERKRNTTAISFVQFKMR